MDALYPLKLSRYLSPRLWGGKKLERFLELPEPYDQPEPLGESWQVYEENRVLNGPLAGQTLADASKRYGERLLGSASQRYGKRFPLLAKFIDAADKLSIQVHPDDAYAHSAEAHTGFHGKTEAWFILEAEAGASIIWGFKEALSKDEVRQRVLNGTLEEVVNTVPVQPGDVVYNPAGTLHGIGAGILLFEIQQSSDLTYRLYDYRRKDASGKARELHVDKALDVLDLTPGNRAKITPVRLDENRCLLVECPFFAMEAWTLEGTLAGQTAPLSAEILTMTAGSARLVTQEGGLALAQGESCVLPAYLGRYRLQGSGTVLRCYVPET